MSLHANNNFKLTLKIKKLYDNVIIVKNIPQEDR